MRILRPRFLAHLALLAAGLLLLTACATPVGVDRAGPDTVYSTIRSNAITRGVPSGTTRTILDRHDLWKSWNRRMPDALDALLDIAMEDGRRDTVFALAELHYLAFLDGWGEEHALASAAFAWNYLFDDGLGLRLDPWEDTVRTAGDLYNRALLEGLRTERGESLVHTLSGEVALPRGTMAVTLDYALPDAREGVALVPADDFEVRGLRVRNRRTGLGVRLIAALPQPESPPLERGVFRTRSPYAATALLVPEGGIAAMAKGGMKATLRIIESAEVRTFQVGDVTAPLAADFTAPFAFALQRSHLWRLEAAAFFAGEPDIPPGLALLTRKPDRIPVVFVHGTASSPGRWAEMVNTLMADREIATRIQVWLFLYPTGNPVAYSAAQLRESLSDAVAEMDPDGTRANLRRMVVIGHSQGGLLTRMVSSSSTDWSPKDAEGRGIGDLVKDEATLAIFQRCLHFQATPEISRAVFICAPHRGSFFAGNWISHLLARFISVTYQLRGAMAEAFGGGNHIIKLPSGMALPTAVDNMTPDSPFVQQYLKMVPGPGVRFHSIVAVQGEGDPSDLDDGIVAYESAHLTPEEAESEFIVQSSHSCQENPLVIEEIRRILLEHIAEGDAAAGKPAAPAK